MCREQAAEFRPHEVELEALGVRLVFISTGTPTMARDFQQTMGLRSTIWVDKERITYDALGFTRSLASFVGVRPALNALRAASKGFMQGRTQGDPWQQGGVVVVRKGGDPVYGYASEVAGDHPPVALVMERAREAGRDAHPAAYPLAETTWSREGARPEEAPRSNLKRQ